MNNENGKSSNGVSRKLDPRILNRLLNPNEQPPNDKYAQPPSEVVIPKYQPPKGPPPYPVMYAKLRRQTGRTGEEGVQIVGKGENPDHQQVTDMVRPDISELVVAVNESLKDQVSLIPSNDTAAEIIALTNGHTQIANQIIAISQEKTAQKPDRETTGGTGFIDFLKSIFGQTREPAIERNEMQLAESKYEGPSYEIRASATQHKAAGMGNVQVKSDSTGGYAVGRGNNSIVAASSTVVSGSIKFNGPNVSIGGITSKSK